MSIQEAQEAYIAACTQGVNAYSAGLEDSSNSDAIAVAYQVFVDLVNAG
jgi:hypothetical protein